MIHYARLGTQYSWPVTQLSGSADRGSAQEKEICVNLI